MSAYEARFARRRRWQRWVRRLLPWSITLAVVAALLSKYSLAGIVAQMRAGTWWPVALAAAGIVTANLFVIAVADRIVIGPSLGPLRYLDAVRGRAATSLLIAVNQTASSGLFGVWLARKMGADVRATVGVVLYITLTTMAAIAIWVTVGLWASPTGASALPAAAAAALHVVAPALAIGLVTLGIGGPLVLPRLRRPPRLLTPWARISPGHYLLVVVGRMVIVGNLIVGGWLAANGFGVPIPLSAMALYLPIILFIGALPINALGFGPVQAVWLVFAGEASGEQVLALQITWRVLITIALVLRGLPFLRRVSGEIAGGPSEPSESLDELPAA
jgi:hypothetical protein